ncbi:MAG: aminopeptidase P N-terminal domain-containing protein [Bacteroidia bacterium]|nr:aminopeptidase P N-terminal domain-containing protein [Bacteroidia bacterium]
MRNFFLLIFISPLLFIGQTGSSSYDDDLLPPEFHKGRREAFRQLMDNNSVAIFFTNPVRQRANDVEFEYHQDPTFYYMTGYTEPDAVLIIFKEKTIIDSFETKELIYVQPRNADDESWTGKRLGKEGVKKQLGFEFAFNNNQFQDLNLDFSKFSKIYYPYTYNDARDDYNDPGDVFSLLKTFNDRTEKCKDKKDYMGFFSKVSALREIKTPEEMKLLRKAIDISVDAHLQVMKNLKPGMKEFQAQAIVEFGFKFAGAEYEGYPSILGGGENSCILHYVTNRKKLNNEDFLVIDAGAEYHGYTADITRTLPTTGKFSEEEKAIYAIVLEAQTEGIKACKKDNMFRAPHNAAVDVIKKRLLELGIIKKEDEFMKYFFHGTSHYLGLDVHDPGLYGRLKPGQVITVEPGIYIPAGSPCDKKWWNIGVRIEDDVLITDGDADVLSGKLPKSIEEIEKLMGAPKTITIPGQN